MSPTPMTHDCYENYELVNVGKVVFNCDGCKMSGTGSRYVCKLCDETLHKWCRFPKIGEVVTHAYCGRCKFIFAEFPGTMMIGGDTLTEVYKRCAACRENISGFSYHCEDESLDMHPGCFKLDKMLFFDDKVFNLRAKMSSLCIGCKRLDPEGWSYVSECSKYHVHVRCLVYKMNKYNLMQAEKGDMREPSLEKTNEPSAVDLKSVFDSILQRFKGTTVAQIIADFLIGKAVEKFIKKDEADDTSKQTKVGYFGTITKYFRILCQKAVAGVGVTSNFIKDTAKAFQLNIISPVTEEIVGFFKWIQDLIKKTSANPNTASSASISDGVLEEIMKVLSSFTLADAAKLVRWIMEKI